MIRLIVFVLIFGLVCACRAFAQTDKNRAEAEYYVSAYSNYYHVPVALVRSIVQQESGWRVCVVSSKGAVGLMQLMPGTAQSLGVKDRCNIRQNIWGGVRYLAWLMRRFQGDLRLVAAAYYTGEYAIAAKGLNYRNPDVVAYVKQVRRIYRNASTGPDLRQISERVSRKSR